MGLNVNVEINMLVFGLRLREEPRNFGIKVNDTDPHEKFNSLNECWNRLPGFFDGPSVFHPVRTIPITILDFTYWLARIKPRRNNSLISSYCPELGNRGLRPGTRTHL
jgi:hypothetical protein